MRHFSYDNLANFDTKAHYESIALAIVIKILSSLILFVAEVAEDKDDHLYMYLYIC